MKTPHLFALAVALVTAVVHAQKPADTLPVGSGLQLQIEPKTTSSPPFKGLPVSASAASDAKIVEEAPGVKKAKGPTQIDALEATFDQKKNEAVFIGDVNVRDPEFNVICDKLTAQLKGAEKEKPKPDAAAPGTKPATPAAPALPVKKKGGSGLHKAIAEANPGNRVNIVQDKVEADGTTQRSVGTADRATYDAVTGDIVLTGKPEIQQGINLVQATTQETVMTLNRDGRMKAKGRTRTVIVDKGDSGL